MKQVIKSTDIALITTEKVEKTFDNKHAYLHVIVKLLKDDEQKQERTYKVRTDLVGYCDVKIQIFNSEGAPQLGSDGFPLFETKEQLAWLEQKQDWSLQTFTYAEIDSFALEVEAQLPVGLTRTAKEKVEIQIIFLAKRKEAAPWGIAANKWRIRTNEDLLKDKA